MKKSVCLLLAFVIFISLFSLYSCTEADDAKKEVSAITLSEKNVSFREIGETYQLSATVTPIDAEDQSLSWKSANPDVATCKDGLITAVGYGVCVVKATAKSGISSSCVVTVGTTTPTLHLSSTVLSFNELGATQTIIPSNTLGEISANDVVWMTSNDKIASCTNGVVLAKSFGICTITAISNGARAICTVVVEEADKPYLYITKNAVEFSGIDQTETIAATVSNDVGMKIEWISSNKSVATVDAGKITATGFGQCVVVAVAENGLSAYSVVTVGEPDAIVTGFESDIRFDVPNLPAISHYVDRQSGIIDSTVVIYGYDLKIYDNTTSSDLDENTLGLMVTLKCVKIYDRNGVDGKDAIIAGISTYRDEAGILCDSKTIKKIDHKIGDEIEISIPIRVAKVAGQQRYFYITVSEYTIL